MSMSIGTTWNILANSYFRFSVKFNRLSTCKSSERLEFAPVSDNDVIASLPINMLIVASFQTTSLEFKVSLDSSKVVAQLIRNLHAVIYM